MTALSALHTVRTRINLDNEIFRDLCEAITNKRSTKDMTDDQRNAVRARLVKDYPAFNKPRQSSLKGTYAKKLQALWISGWNLGLIKNRKDAALIAFVKRQTGIQSTSWLRNPKDADKAVEALKKWLERAGVDWSVGKAMPKWAKLPGYTIAYAQCRILNSEDPDGLLAATLRQQKPAKIIQHMKAADWIKVMNALGEQIRENAKLAKAG